jgi:alkylhydroperoxidase family enzyme
LTGPGRPVDYLSGNALPAWAETPFFTARERAALAFTESVTLVAGDHAWNALAVTTRAWVPGSYGE